MTSVYQEVIDLLREKHAEQIGFAFDAHERFQFIDQSVGDDYRAYEMMFHHEWYKALGIFEALKAVHELMVAENASSA